MTRNELTTRLGAIKNGTSLAKMQTELAAIIEDIKEDGVLDVQQPPALINVQRIRARGHVTLEELSAMTLQDIATFSR